MADERIEIEIVLDDGSIKKGFAKIKKEGKGAATDVGKGFTKSFATAAKAAAGIAVALAGVGFALKKAIGAAIIQEDAIKGFETALLTSGKTAEISSERFQKFASSLQDVTRFGDEATLGAASLIQSLGALDEEGLKRATIATQDLASALRIDLQSAAILVGKAAAGEVGSFSRFGLVVKKAANNSDTLANALTAIEGKFGGAAREAVKTFGGRVEQSANAMGDLWENIGFVIIRNPTFLKAITSSTKVINGFSQALINLFPETFASEKDRIKFQIRDLKEEIDNLKNSADLSAFGGPSVFNFDPSQQTIGVKELIAEIAILEQGLAKIVALETAVSDSTSDGTLALEKQAKAAKALGDTMRKTLGGGISSGIQTAVKSIMDGQNAFEAFGKATLAVFGDLAIQLGQFFITTALATLALKGLDPTGSLVAGIALVALGTMLKGIGGGSPAGGGVAAGNDVATTAETTATSGEPAGEVQEKVSQVNITVEGTVLDPRGVGLQISEILKEAQESNGVFVGTVTV